MTMRIRTGDSSYSPAAPRPESAWFGIRYPWAFLLAAVLQRLPFTLLQADSFLELKKGLLILSYLVLAWGLLHNLHLRSTTIILLGALLNFAAIAANGALMPVAPEARSIAGMSDAGQLWLGKAMPLGPSILLSAEQTHLNFLTDIIPIVQVKAVFSIGDIFLFGGLLALFFEVVFGRRAEK